jgi:hypothetical protein
MDIYRIININRIRYIIRVSISGCVIHKYGYITSNHFC